MGTIAFKTPRIADKETYGSDRYSQKGPTCWYYVSKMLTKMHGVKRDEMRALHWVRKAISQSDELGSILKNKKYDDLEEIAARLKRIAGEYDEWIGHYENVRDNYNKSSKQYDHELKKAATLAFKFRLTTGDYDTAKRKRNEIETAREAIKKLDDNHRIKFLEGFAPGLFKQEEVQPEKMTPESVEKLLRKWGPFYAGGNLSAKRKDVTASDVGSKTFEKDLRMTVSVLDEGAHAVMVAGINAQTGVLYYKDPHNTEQLRSIAFDVFHGGWTSLGTCTVIVMKCPVRDDNAYAEKGGCVHAQGNIVIDSEELILGSLFD